MNRAVAVLMFSLFCIGSAEFVIAGLLPGISDDLDVSIASAGLLVSAYALTVVVAGPALTLLTSGMRRKHVMVGLMVLFALSNLLAAFAQDYAVLMVSRVLSALAHCTFFALSLVVGTSTVAPDRQGSVIAKLAIGLNMANVLGVPLGVLLGTELGWRSVFWVLAGCGVVSAWLVAVLVPADQKAEPPAGVRAEIRTLGRSRVLIAVAISALGCGGTFTAYTYIAPLLEDVSGFRSGAVGLLLLLFGLGTFAGSVVGGRLVDRALMPALTGLFGTLALVLGLFSVLVANPWTAAVGLVLFGAAFGAILPGLQARVMQAADIKAPTFALAVNIAAMNVGITLGSWLGGRVLEAGLGLQAVVLTGSAVAAVGFLVAGIELLRDRNRTAPQVADVQSTPAH
ncbi:MFS transporter [Promicromonospora iranensis]|uniref:DHA1 family inner membrane transport protein n=1 Tax=Promicromonospora iranensis TaxID=1105144 RepID=A0ABU2CUA6_9MICO|nr:MFS transporter [Promicromonospora iranensis]MDR7384922.1 DHA1 family inner membrane transport protein [Promicromonospora iranensis]